MSMFYYVYVSYAYKSENLINYLSVCLPMSAKPNSLVAFGYDNTSKSTKVVNTDSGLSHIKQD